MDGDGTGHTEVTGGIARQRGGGGNDALRGDRAQRRTLSGDLALGNGCLVGVIGDGHIHGDTGGEGLGVGGSCAAGIGGKLAGNGNGCYSRCFVIGLQGLALRKLLIQRELVYAVVVQTQNLGQLGIVRKPEGNLQGIGHQTVAGVGRYGYINRFAQIDGRRHTDHAAGGFRHIELGVGGRGCCTGTGRRGGSGADSGLGGCLGAEHVGLIGAKLIFDAKACQSKGFRSRALNGEQVAAGQIRQGEAVQTVSVIVDGDRQLQIFLNVLIRDVVAVGFHGNDDPLTVVVGRLGQVEDHFVLAVGHAFHLCQIGNTAVAVGGLAELAKAQLALLGRGLRGFGITVAVVDLQLYALGRELQRHIVKGHHKGEAAGAVGRYFQILGGAVFHIGDKQLDVVAGQAHIVVVLLCDIIQGALLDGMDDHRCAAANLGVAVVIGAGGAADLIAVFRRGLAAGRGGIDGLLDAVEDRQEFRVDPVLLRRFVKQTRFKAALCLLLRGGCVVVNTLLLALHLFA